jgi:thioredoxin 1
MPLICIGPVCVPVSAVLPLILWALRPLWEALPEGVRMQIERAVRPLLDWMDAHVWSKMRGLFGSAPSSAPHAGGKGRGASAGGATHGGTSAGALDASLAAKLMADLDSGSTSVHSIHTQEQLEAMLAVSEQRGCAVVLDFTAPWCGPCQRIKPRYAELAKGHPSHIFAAIDVDEAPELQATCNVVVLPTFQIFYGKTKAHEERGGTNEAIDRLQAKLEAAKKAE